MNETLESIYGRSSVRRYRADRVPEEDVREIIRAGFHAATGMNRQALEFSVAEDPGFIRRCGRRAVSLLAESADPSDGIGAMARSLAADPSSDIFYGAPAVVFVFARPDAATPVEDGALAIGNMMLAARSMGYGTCYIGLAAAIGGDRGLMAELGAPADRRYLACMTLGRPDGEAGGSRRPEARILGWVK
ncbi:MAG: nitroreductase family protein [Candidatus Methanoplasma sp.]|jgi:nitroreductase|nr:nitroreductase family protein [Candidatus Methanoplasma sp.]